MKIYLLSANKDSSIIERIKSTLKNSNHKVDVNIIDVKNKDDYSSDEVNHILKYDLVLVEGSNTNAQLGYESAFALEKGVPVVVLYHDETGNRDLFPLMALNPKSKLIIRGYKVAELETQLEDTVNEVENYNNNQFRLSFNKQTSDYLKWVSENKKITKSDYIRGLIDLAMKKDTKYKSYIKPS